MLEGGSLGSVRHGRAALPCLETEGCRTQVSTSGLWASAAESPDLNGHGVGPQGVLNKAKVLYSVSLRRAAATLRPLFANARPFSDFYPRQAHAVDESITFQSPLS